MALMKMLYKEYTLFVHSFDEQMNQEPYRDVDSNIILENEYEGCDGDVHE
jgi:hypothetical protein